MLELQLCVIVSLPHIEVCTNVYPGCRKLDESEDSVVGRLPAASAASTALLVASAAAIV